MMWILRFVHTNSIPRTLQKGQLKHALSFTIKINWIRHIESGKWQKFGNKVNPFHAIDAQIRQSNFERARRISVCISDWQHLATIIFREFGMHWRISTNKNHLKRSNIVSYRQQAFYWKKNDKATLLSQKICFPTKTEWHDIITKPKHFFVWPVRNISQKR